MNLHFWVNVLAVLFVVCAENETSMKSCGQNCFEPGTTQSTVPFHAILDPPPYIDPPDYASVTPIGAPPSYDASSKAGKTIRFPLYTIKKFMKKYAKQKSEWETQAFREANPNFETDLEMATKSYKVLKSKLDHEYSDEYVRKYSRKLQKWLFVVGVTLGIVLGAHAGPLGLALGATGAGVLAMQTGKYLPYAIGKAKDIQNDRKFNNKQTQAMGNIIDEYQTES